jgi:hypothetical protein
MCLCVANFVCYLLGVEFNAPDAASFGFGFLGPARVSATDTKLKTNTNP